MFDFLKYTKIYAFISFLIIGIGLFSVLRWGFNYSIDFVGGSNLEYQFDTDVQPEAVTKILTDNKIEVIDIRKEGKTIAMRTKVVNEQQEAILKNDLTKKLNTKLTVLRSETVGPTIGKETLQKTLIAAGIAVVGILLYISYAFKSLNYALAAVTALFHDVVVVVGMYSLISHFFGAELDTLFVTALLTTMSFSVHDTIVVFDQMRDYQKRFGKGHIEMYANKSLTETMVRSLNNSMTIVFMLLALVLLGGSTIRFFAITLLIGTVVGTYSSPFVATPIAVWLEKRKKR